MGHSDLLIGDTFSDPQATSGPISLAIPSTDIMAVCAPAPEHIWATTKRDSLDIENTNLVPGTTDFVTSIICKEREEGISEQQLNHFELFII